MSYARFSEGDIYLYACVSGGIFCCSCRLVRHSEESSRLWKFDTYDDAIAHVRKHIEAGDRVPEHTIPALEADRDAGESLAPMDVGGGGE